MPTFITVCAALLVAIWVSLPAQSPPPAVTFDRIVHADREPHNWLTYSGTLQGERHTGLRQITPGNVENLEIAWVAQATTADKIEATPLAVDGTLYMVFPTNDVTALSGATGRVLWNYRHTPAPRARASGGGGRPNRGLAIVGDTLFLGTLDAHLLAIHRTTGKVVWDVVVADIEDPQCRLPPTVNRGCYAITQAPLVVKDKVMVGVGGGDAEATGVGLRGFVAAYDATTGRPAWRSYTVPAAGEPGSETWSGESWKNGGAAVWNTGAYDPELNLTYWGTGNPAPPGVFGASPEVRQGDNLFSNSLVALDADSGARRWHFQFTPHDNQDWDSAHVPVLADITWQGRTRKAIISANKNGLLYVLDRATGEFLLGKPFVEVNWLSGLDQRGRPLRTLTKVLGSEEPLVKPGSATNWYPPSYSRATGLFYVAAWERSREMGTFSRGPSYAAIRAFDPSTAERKWEFRIDNGYFESGVLTTASDLVFTGVTGDFASPVETSRQVDGNFYAIHARTGRELWRRSLGGSVTGGPMSYSVNGRQFIAVAAGHALFGFALRP
jgi:alcohol dehydrogenase (cytochrome c)